MRHAMRRLAAAILAGPALACGAAVAQEHPPLLPSREAVVEYRVQGGKPGATPIPVRIYFSGDRLRAEAENMRGYVIVNRQADRAMLVMEQPRTYFEVPLQSGLTRDYLLNDDMTYAKRGKDRVAGIPCTVWDVHAPQGRTATVCISADGLILRGEGHDPKYGDGSLEALSVTYAAQPDKLFQPPTGYSHLQIPLVPGLTGPRP